MFYGKFSVKFIVTLAKQFSFLRLKGKYIIWLCPQHLRQHMNDCHITLRDNQIPIEVLLKVGANGYNDNSVIELLGKATEDMSERYEQNMRNEVKLFPNSGDQLLA